MKIFQTRKSASYFLNSKVMQQNKEGVMAEQIRSAITPSLGFVDEGDPGEALNASPAFAPLV